MYNREENKKSMQDSMKSIMNNLNDFGMNSSEIGKELAEVINKEHRTIQQKTISTLINCLLTYADIKYYDDRNEASVKICQKIRDYLKDEIPLPKNYETNSYKWAEPF